MSLTPVTFTNRGPACHLPRYGPTFRFAFGPTGPANTLPPDELSYPASGLTAAATRLGRGAKVVIDLVVVTLPGPMVKRCHRSTAHEFIVQGYAKGAGVGVYFIRRVPNVCSTQSDGAQVNFGPYWPPHSLR